MQTVLFMSHEPTRLISSIKITQLRYFYDDIFKICDVSFDTICRILQSFEDSRILFPSLLRLYYINNDLIIIILNDLNQVERRIFLSKESL